MILCFFIVFGALSVFFVSVPVLVFAKRSVWLFSVFFFSVLVIILEEANFSIVIERFIFVDSFLTFCVSIHF